MVCTTQVALATNHPCVLLNSTELDELREDIKQVEWKRYIYERDEPKNLGMAGGGMRSNARRWLTKKVVIPARGGHYHHFFCDCGSILRFPPDGKPRKEGYPCTECEKVYKGEKYDAVVRWWVHNTLAAAAFHCSLVYALDEDEQFAEKTAEILRKYALVYPGPHTSLLEGGMIYQSLDESIWSIALASSYDFIYNSNALSSRDKNLIESRLFGPIASGLMRMGVRGNWESWHLSAVGVIGYTIHDPALIDYALNRFKQQIAEELGDDGLWPESIHAYHFFPLTAFLYLAEAARHNGTDLYNWKDARGLGLRAMFTEPLRYLYPNFQIPAINDGWYKTMLPLSVYELAYARYKLPELGWALKEGYKTLGIKRDGLWALSHGEKLDGVYTAPDLTSANFPVLGISTLRSAAGNMVTFDYGPLLGHGQLDKMGITLFAEGKLLAADYGTPGYGSPIVSWYTGTAAHNTVLVDCKAQQKTDERRLTTWYTSPLFDVAEAVTEQAYPGVKQTRTVLRVGENFIIVDDLKSDDEHNYDWFFKSEGKFYLDATDSLKIDQPFPYEHVMHKSQHRTKGAWTGCWQFGAVALRLTMLDDTPAVLCVSECPAETANRLVPLVIARKTGKEARFTASLIPLSANGKAVADISHGLIRLKCKDFEDYVSTSSGSPYLSTDGAYAFVRLTQGKLVAAAVVAGQTVKWRGTTLIDTNSKASYYWSEKEQ